MVASHEKSVFKFVQKQDSIAIGYTRIIQCNGTKNTNKSRVIDDGWVCDAKRLNMTENVTE